MGSVDKCDQYLSNYEGGKIDETVEKIYFRLFEIITNNIVVYFERKLAHLFQIHPFSTPLKTSENRKVF